MKKEDKILLCVNSDIGRGNTIGARFEKIAGELKERKIDFDIIARANYNSDLSVKVPSYKNYFARFLNAVRIYVFPKFNYRNFEIKLFDFFVLRSLKNQKVDYKVAHFGEPLLNSIKYLKDRGVKIFLDMPIGHVAYGIKLKKEGVKIGVEKLEESDLLNKSIKYSDRLIVPSEFVRYTLEVAGFEDKKMYIIPFGVDIKNDFGESNIEKKLKDKKIKFLFAGNVNFRKGIKYLLEAWEKAKLENAELLICGRVFKEIKNEIEKYELKNVKFEGFVDLKSYYKKSHVFIFPTLLEGSSKAVYEAMNYGLPVITTYNAGSIIEDGKSGFIIPIADVESIKEKIIYFYNNREKIIEMGYNARQKVQDYSWKKYANNVVSVYCLD